ncbi:MAG: hypothetical protein U1A22_06180, partial [Xanthomonadaceae bacterium]|nr:hypothetical protein [Xanthomonadaceae bacterium]
RPPMWLLYADPEVDRLRRSGSGSFTPIIGWLHYGDPGMALLGRSMTPTSLCAVNPLIAPARRYAPSGAPNLP